MGSFRIFLIWKFVDSILSSSQFEGWEFWDFLHFSVGVKNLNPKNPENLGVFKKKLLLCPLFWSYEVWKVIEWNKNLFPQTITTMKFFPIFFGNFILGERSFFTSHSYEKVINPEKYVYHRKIDLKGLASVSPESIRNAKILAGKRSKSENSNLWTESFPGIVKITVKILNNWPRVPLGLRWWICSIRGSIRRKFV